MPCIPKRRKQNGSKGSKKESFLQRARHYALKKLKKQCSCHKCVLKRQGDGGKRDDVIGNTEAAEIVSADYASQGDAITLSLSKTSDEIVTVMQDLQTEASKGNQTRSRCLALAQRLDNICMMLEQLEKEFGEPDPKHVFEPSPAFLKRLKKQRVSEQENKVDLVCAVTQERLKLFSDSEYGAVISKRKIQGRSIASPSLTTILEDEDILDLSWIPLD